MVQIPQQQDDPGTEAELPPKADPGEESYKGCDKLVGKVAIVPGGHSGIGCALAIAFSSEGADLVISDLSEHEDARETQRLVEAAGRRCLLIPGDVGGPAHCRSIVQRTVAEFGRVDILVNNAPFEMSRDSLDEIPDEEWVYTFHTNIHAMFYLAKAAVPHLKEGSAVVNTSSVNSDKAPPQLLAEMGIRVNCVAPGPIWTPLIPAIMPGTKVATFGMDVPMKRPGQPRGVAPLFVFLASDASSYVTGAQHAMTGGTPVL